MERRHCGGKHPPPLLAPPRRGHGERRHGGASSFSASLLDAIYRSLDEGGDGAGEEGDHAVAVAAAAAARRSEEKAAAPAAVPQFWWSKEVSKAKQTAAGAERLRRREAAVGRPRHSGYASSTSSSSTSDSSYRSFSCSSASTTDAESTRRRRSAPPPPPPGEVDADADAAESAAPPSIKAKKKGRPCFPGARFRARGGAAPPSPGPPLPPSPATFACVLKTLFTTARLPSKKPKTPAASIPTPQITSPAPPHQPSCTPATTASPNSVDVSEAAERRSVRFGPATEASVVRRRVEELVRTLGELEEDEEASDSSSDLFELESIRGADGDELPVYGTTSIAANRAIAQSAPVAC